MEKKNKYCQSCGIPMKKDPQGGGTNANGSQNSKYCSFCYQKGHFTFQGSAKEFQEHCRQAMIKGGHSRFTAWLFTRGINRLERWKKVLSKPLVHEQEYNASVEKVWNALTRKEEMKEWYFDIAEFEPKIGFQFQFWGGDEHQQYLHLCEVTEVVQNNKIAYTWRYREYEVTTVVRFELFPEAGKTRLRLTHENVGGFPQDNPAFSIESFTEGWNYILGTSLKEYLKKELGKE